jgi:hypothetical protein
MLIKILWLRVEVFCRLQYKSLTFFLIFSSICKGCLPGGDFEKTTIFKTTDSTRARLWANKKQSIKLYFQNIFPLFFIPQSLKTLVLTTSFCPPFSPVQSDLLLSLLSHTKLFTFKIFNCSFFLIGCD